MMCAYERYVQNVTAGLCFNDKAMKTVNKLGRASLPSGVASKELAVSYTAEMSKKNACLRLDRH